MAVAIRAMSGQQTSKKSKFNVGNANRQTVERSGRIERHLANEAYTRMKHPQFNLHHTQPCRTKQLMHP
jgi:hypothetical protein